VTALLSLTPILLKPLSLQVLVNSLQESELAQKRLLAMGLRLSLSLAERQFRHCLSADLSDFVHDGLITFFDAVESFDSSRGVRLSAYAYSQIRSRFTKFNRDYEKSFRASKLGTLIDFDSSPLEIEEKATNVYAALNELPERQRLILVKRFGIRCQIQSVQDIAKAFGVSYETIRKDQIAAMSVLKKNRNLKALVA
jgi:RNA polymerase primary sigma factor